MPLIAAKAKSQSRECALRRATPLWDPTSRVCTGNGGGGASSSGRRLRGQRPLINPSSVRFTKGYVISSLYLFSLSR